MRERNVAGLGSGCRFDRHSPQLFLVLNASRLRAAGAGLSSLGTPLRGTRKHGHPRGRGGEGETNLKTNLEAARNQKVDRTSYSRSKSRSLGSPVP
jgi:hypothetical protein